VRRAAVDALGALAKDNKEKTNAVIDALIARLRDYNGAVRRAAVDALGVLAMDNKEKTNATIDALITSMNDGVQVQFVRSAAAVVLTRMPNPLDLPHITAMLGSAAERPLAAEARMEAAFHVLSGGDRKLSHLLPLLQRSRRERTRYPDPEVTLALFVTVWPMTVPYAELRRQIAWHAKNITERACLGAVGLPSQSAGWSLAWVASLWDAVHVFSFSPCLSPVLRQNIEALRRLFQEAKLVESRDLDRLLREEEGRDRFVIAAWWSTKIIGAHGILWVALLWLYPRYTWVQAVFFWNPWVRKLFGLHLSLLIPLLPFVRRRLLAPFRSALGPKSDCAGAIVVAEMAWFPDTEVTEGNGRERVPIARALPRIQGLTVLEGESGLGKTVHLVRLAHDSKRVVAFVKAGEEGGDVIKAIAARLPAEVIRDDAFLRTLIHAGGLDICIDGLNEVSADARSAVASFAQANTRANILISTQPIRWNRPAGARVLRLQPLRAEQRRAFLVSREVMLPENAPLRGERFQERVQGFVHEMETTTPTDVEEQVARERALSNPMDLTTIAFILAQGGRPDLLNLQRTAYLQAAAQYKTDNQGAEFPLTAFSEYVYAERCKATGHERELIVLQESRFAAECDALADQRLLLTTMGPNAAGNEAPAWRFRHDKVLDFFLYVALTSAGTMKVRVREHIGDTRFRGVYLLLALEAPLDVAKEIRDQLADHAVEARDHGLSDEVWDVVRQRLEAEPRQTRSEVLADTLTLEG
jgi:hypothetical protein